MKKLIQIAVVLVLLTCSNMCFAWGPDGHKIVAEIARNYMPKSVQDSVQKYLADMSFEAASTWMDDVRKDPNYTHMKTWHYVNIEKDKTYVKNTDHNIVNEIELAIYQLMNKTDYKKDELTFAIKVLFHLIGDIQMPLHSGYENDKGGNSVDVDFLGKKENLHYVWDVSIILNKKMTAEKCIRMGDALSKTEVTKILKADVISWVNEDRALLPSVYDFKDNTITQSYIDANAPVIEKRLLYGGLRLASVMSKAFTQAKK